MIVPSSSLQDVVSRVAKSFMPHHKLQGSWLILRNHPSIGESCLFPPSLPSLHLLSFPTVPEAPSLAPSFVPKTSCSSSLVLAFLWGLSDQFQGLDNFCR